MAVAHFEGFRGVGFDGGVKPPWLTVSALPPARLFTRKEINLMDGAGWTLSSADESVAEITEDPTFLGPYRQISVFGKGRGVTHILGAPPGGLPPLRLLEVEVKNERKLKVAFNFVVDSHFEKTTRPTIPNFMNQLRHNTNQIFEAQANLTFDVLREKEIQVRTSLRDIIGRQDRGDLAFSGELRPPYHEWYKLVDEGDSQAEINVFFIARSILNKENTFPPLVFGQDGNIVIEDDPSRRIERVERDLAHWIAIMLGCTRTNERGKADHLMSRSNDVTARFIPKECANILNPTF
jgi:hypothetical protein